MPDTPKQETTGGLFGDLPVARHPAAAVTWCRYPVPDDTPPARDCLRFKRGEARNPHDCRECEHVERTTNG